MAVQSRASNREKSSAENLDGLERGHELADDHEHDAQDWLPRRPLLGRGRVRVLVRVGRMRRSLAFVQVPRDAHEPDADHDERHAEPVEALLPPLEDKP